MMPILFAALTVCTSPEVSIIDSRDDSRTAYVIVKCEEKTCKVLVTKKSLKERMALIIEVVIEKCGL